MQVLSLLFLCLFCLYFLEGHTVPGFVRGVEFRRFWHYLLSENLKTQEHFISSISFSIWIGVIIFGYISNGIHKIDLTYGMSDITFERKVILTIGAIVLIVPLTAIFGKFASCKYICWQAPFMIIGTKIRDSINLNGLRIISHSEACNECKECTKICPMNLDVMENVKRGKCNNTECILCGNCIDHCKNRVLRFSFKKQNPAS